MVVWSSVRPLLANQLARNTLNAVVPRNMSGHHRTLPYQPSRWQWNKFKDLFHFYTLLGVIPLGIIVTLTNIFVGPAQLAEIPEGYTPKYWEYYRHPISRFIARYILTNPQQEYEKLLHYQFEEQERIQLRTLETKIKEKMKERMDYQAYYYRPVLAKYHRMSKDAADYLKTIRGE